MLIWGLPKYFTLNAAGWPSIAVRLDKGWTNLGGSSASMFATFNGDEAFRLFSVWLLGVNLDFKSWNEELGFVLTDELDIRSTEYSTS